MSGKRNPRREIEQATRAVGGRIETTNNGHLKVYGPGGMTTIASKMGTRQRTWPNTVARLRAIGIDPRPRPGRTAPKAAS